MGTAERILKEVWSEPNFSSDSSYREKEAMKRYAKVILERVAENAILKIDKNTPFIINENGFTIYQDDPHIVDKDSILNTPLD